MSRIYAVQNDYDFGFQHIAIDVLASENFGFGASYEAYKIMKLYARNLLTRNFSSLGNMSKSLHILDATTRGNVKPF